ncbi:hypothetical protein GOC33_24240 [Sinorhizobium meliloti]|nr:hypothetical protein [Sinorhizobium meliloti]RVK30117.1 hypothetical protein CN163_27805 [Sinorhizobium meliloti]
MLRPIGLCAGPEAVEDKFRWPRREVAVVTLTTEQLHWILDGIDIDAMVRHPVRQYQVAG